MKRGEITEIIIMIVKVHSTCMYNFFELTEKSQVKKVAKVTKMNAST